ncbi:hypothetical protein THASP1DRAFT_15509, partial [Thamnocephalis sphaerospora]
VPTIITWTQGGQAVYVTGTFNRWRRKVRLVKSSPSDDDFTTVLHLPVGTHQLKFIVDDEWRCSDDLGVAPDTNGNLVNYVAVEPEPVFDEPVMSEECARTPRTYARRSHASSPAGSYTNVRPHYLDALLQPWSPLEDRGDIDDEEEEEVARVRRMQPPALPPHLERVLLNNTTVSRDDDSALPAPQHVELNHLYACSIRDGVMAMATTKRYREKFITTVYYKPVLQP